MTAPSQQPQNTSGARRDRHRHVSALLVVTVLTAAVLTAATMAWREEPQPAGQRLRITVTTTSDPACDVDPEVTRAGTRHIDVRTKPGTGPVTVRLLREAGDLVFEATVKDSGSHSPERSAQEMAKLLAGMYTLECRTTDATLHRQLRVVNP